MIIASVESFVDSLEHLTGFLIVLVALSLLWGITALIGKLVERHSTSAAVAKPAAANTSAAGAALANPATAADSAAADDPSEEEVAAICATIACLLEQPHRIVSIRSANISWGREGLREHFASHRIR